MVYAKEKKIVRTEDTISYKAYSFVRKNWFTIVCMVAMLVTLGCSVAYADKADDMWTKIQGTLSTWIERLGGMVVFVGGIMFALGWKRDDADQKSQGVSTIIAGALVVAITASINTFLGGGATGGNTP